MSDTNKPLFWRDPRMPHVELRKVDDGRRVCYAPHSHAHWSLGAITAGESTFRYREDCYHVHAGTLVLMNPDWLHACRAIDDRPWAYLMLYVDTDWLTELRHRAGLLASPRWQDLATAVIREPWWYAGYCRMTACLLDPDRDLLDKQTEVIEYLSALMHELAGQPARPVARAPAVLKGAGGLPGCACVGGDLAGRPVRAFRLQPGPPDTRLQAALRLHAPRLPDQPAHPAGPARSEAWHADCRGGAECRFRRPAALPAHLQAPGGGHAQPVPAALSREVGTSS